ARRVFKTQLHLNQLAPRVALFHQEVGVGGVSGQVVRVLDESLFEGFSQVGHERSLLQGSHLSLECGGLPLWHFFGTLAFPEPTIPERGRPPHSKSKSLHLIRRER